MLPFRLPSVAVLLFAVGHLIVIGCEPVETDPVERIHDLVILEGRVIDPETELDGIRNVAIADGHVEAVSEQPLQGRDTIMAQGLIVAPGFIDMHSHGQDEENYRVQAMDGVTTALELEVGTADVDAWYGKREGRALINHGVSVGHIPLRIDLFDDPSDFLPSGPAVRREASEAEIATLRSGIERGLEEGALGVGFGLQYTTAASRWEILEAFRAAGLHGAPAFVHKRYMGDQDPRSSVAALQEVISAAVLTGAPLHIHHIHSVGIHATPQLLQMVTEARERGLDITAEVYPYTAAMTAIESAILDEGWQDVLGVDYGDLEWAATGERLTAETFQRYRSEGGGVIMHFIPEEAKREALLHPRVVVASDGRLRDGVGHPRTAGTFSRVLGRFVREDGLLDWNEAIRKMSTLPALRLGDRTPAFHAKGRVQPGADADLAIFDPETVEDRATFEEPAAFSNGMRYVLVHGVFVVRNGELQEDVLPGRGVRAARE